MKTIVSILLTIFCISASYAQVGINADNSAPHSSAQLDVKSTTKAFYPPRMTTIEKDAIVGKQAGAVVYDITLGALSFYNGTTWSSGGGSSFTIPYSNTTSSTAFDGLFKISNTSTSDSYAITGRTSATDAGFGISGYADNTAQTFSLVAGVYGANFSNNTNGVGVRAYHSGSGYAFYGNTGTGIGAYLSSTSGYSLQTRGKIQFAGNGVGALGANKFIKSINANGDGEWAELLPYNLTINNSALDLFKIINTATGSNTSIFGSTNSLSFGSAIIGNASNSNPSGNTYGIVGQNFSTNGFGYGVFGLHSGTGSAVFGTATNGTGLAGNTNTGTAIKGEAASSGTGGYFNSTSGYALVTNVGNVGIGTLTPASKMDIKGSSNFSHFYYGANEDTYLRGGKATSNVIINDVGNNVGIKTAFPFYDLTFKSDLGDKISFWGGEISTTTNHYGIGMQGGQLQFFVPTNSDNLVFGTGRSASFTERMRVTGGGNVGIGTNNPIYKLQVNTADLSPGMVHQNPAGVSVGSYIGFSAGWYGTFSNHPLALFVNNGNAAVTLTTNEQLQVGGTATPAGFKMSVDGKLICTELEVKVTPWADYVFDKNYKLKPLDEVESFIEKNHHLPNIPKAQDIENQSLALGNMAKLQMEKIEELTLYVIEINKRLQKVEKENAKLKSEIKTVSTKN